MSWTERLKQPSFRGVPFHVPESSGQFGRNVVVHEMPGRTPIVQDLGPATEEFEVEGYIVGEDFDLERNKFLLAVNKEGPGKLIHPTFGQQLVHVKASRWRENYVRRRRVFSFTLTCVPADTLAISSVVDTGAAVEAAADSWLDELAADFADAFSTLGEIADEAQDVAETIGVYIDKAKALVAGALAKIEDVSASIRTFTDDLAGLITAPAQLAAALKGAVGAIFGGLSKIDDALGAYRSMDSRTLPAVQGSTPTRAIEASNQAQLLALLKDAALANAVKATTSAPLGSRQKALAVRDELLADLEARIDTAEAGALDALYELRATLVNHIDAVAGELPRIATFTTPREMDAALVSYAVHGEVTDARVADILARNAISHPAFIPAGTSLEVLVDA